MGAVGVSGETQFPRRPGPGTDLSVSETYLMVRNDGFMRVSALGTEGCSRPAPAAFQGPPEVGWEDAGSHCVGTGKPEQLPGAPGLSGGGGLNR